MSQSDTTGKNAFKAKLQKLQKYMDFRKLPEDLKDCILTHYKYKWSRSQILDEENIMKILPKPLQMDLSHEVLQFVIEKVPVLRDSPIIMQKRFALAMSLQICPPRSAIYRAGDIGWEIYFIGSGLVEITVPDDLSVLDLEGRFKSAEAKKKTQFAGNLLRTGNHFGESCLLSKTGVRPETATSKIISEVYILSKSDIEVIFAYTTPENIDNFRHALRTRNGNMQFSFHQKPVSDIDETIKGCSKFDDVGSLSDFADDAKKINYKLSSGKNLNSDCSPSMHGRYHLHHASNRGKRDWRLRSFSAQASKDALEIRRQLKQKGHHRSKSAIKFTDTVKDSDFLNKSTNFLHEVESNHDRCEDLDQLVESCPSESYIHGVDIESQVLFDPG
eukprot:CAMPEP_0113299800 /NCGR_PEP_ID=MMETSP0010_2-20120614/1685_1 /TAXON_ID=216773 ORGANISM="Corethron hystrix, Strain 308" /NCGR_SAMPLE_ID=MMETSP0010_2 /ASSEMBLY_ACC=CAM_ASM_000155 /LENGTH=387 /DNA_ID=CAMNT_0000153097 /DNA_START=1943 /DNA_END=3106 /DNA_ORIENTATION=+ /assembly_acc=CAM_ASM_000155